ncbi:MAG: RNA polymerase sigma factor [Coprococcus sp.]
MKQQQLLELYDNYSDNAFRLAMSFLGNIADSEDIVQNVYTKLIEKVLTYQGAVRSPIFSP